MISEDILGRVLTELPRVLAAMCETSASKRPATAAVTDGFVVVITGSGDLDGDLRLYFDRAGAAAIARLATGSALEPNDAAIGDTLRNLCGRLSGAVDVRRPQSALVVTSAAAVSAVPSVPASASIDIVIKGVEQVLRVAGESTLVPVAASAAPRRDSKTLDVIMDIDLPLVVRFGRTELPLKTLTTLGPGSVIDLGRAPDDPVEVLISNRVVARGEVVIVAGSYGVRVHDVVSAAERARSLEAELA